MTNASAVAMKAMIRISRPPSRKRDQTSWPSLSLPNSEPSTWRCVGFPPPTASPPLNGAKYGPSIATPTMRVTSNNPSQVRPIERDARKYPAGLAVACT